jgi:hypothetical protein
MKKILFSFIILLPVLLSAENYQYQYFNGDNKYLPFSDYIPEIRLHYKTVPHYVEDFYLLYGMKLYYNENSLRRNIDRMKTAMNCKFRHPSEALVKVDSEDEYLKYRRLMFMHINLLIMRDTMKIAARYDKHRVKFYNTDFAKEINESLDIADRIYREAIPYWEAAKKYAYDASKIKITTDLGNMESERYTIIKGELDYGKIINSHITKLTEKRRKLAEYSAKK